ncbi:hypothetical protein DL764_010568 [Monosporascus ibericus]|uniref:Fatty acid hydroxylase domain-containing protein n=1 Tax=Monosporascus ibericus TaxID=155417 RepID=A0A4Q4SV41_9PEZI|nr:hypothetical protein DL764_010568 [Monosporascus ibericus]
MADARLGSLLVARLALGTLIATAVLLPDLWQPLISKLYRFLYGWEFFNLSFFETIETVVCYITIEPAYTAIFAGNPHRRIDIRHAESKRQPAAKTGGRTPPLPKMARPSRRMRELVTYVSPLLLLDLILIKKYAGVDVEAIRQSGGYAATAAEDDTPSSRISGHFLLPTLHNFSLQSPVQLSRALPAEPPTSRRVLIELLVSLFLYDTAFFAIHLLFHRVPALHRVHGPHHNHGEMHPQVTNRLSIIERLALVLLANFCLNIIGSHVLTRACFVPVFVYLFIEIHSGVDLPWQYDKILPYGWGAGTRKHAAHHREGKRFFEPFFCWWDYALENWERRNAT